MCYGRLLVELRYLTTKSYQDLNECWIIIRDGLICFAPRKNLNCASIEDEIDVCCPGSSFVAANEVSFPAILDVFLGDFPGRVFP